jgi:thymidylate synthase ThyX
MANVGLTINARALEYAIKKMLSSELEEVRLIGAEMKTVATQELPTLVKYADPIAFLPKLREKARDFANQIDTISGAPWCDLKAVDESAEDKVLAAVLYRFGDDSYQVCLDQVLSMSLEEKQALVDVMFEEMSDFDIPIRELEYTDLTFSLIMDQGAYFEFKRHRMMTQTVQDLTTRLGYALPKAVTEAGFEARYREAMQAAAVLYEKLAAWNPQVASYVVPNAYNRRVLCHANVRELFHFIKLRCAKNAHFSIQRVGWGMLEQMRPYFPLLSRKIQVKGDTSVQDLTVAYFSDTAIVPEV